MYIYFKYFMYLMLRIIELLVHNATTIAYIYIIYVYVLFLIRISNKKLMSLNVIRIIDIYKYIYINMAQKTRIDVRRIDNIIISVRKMGLLTLHRPRGSAARHCSRGLVLGCTFELGACGRSLSIYPSTRKIPAVKRSDLPARRWSAVVK